MRLQEKPIRPQSKGYCCQPVNHKWGTSSIKSSGEKKAQFMKSPLGNKCRVAALVTLSSSHCSPLTSCIWRISFELRFRCTSRLASSSIFFASSSINFLCWSSCFAAWVFADKDCRHTWTWKVSIYKGIFELIDWPFWYVFLSDFFSAFVLGETNRRFAWTWKVSIHKGIFELIEWPFWYVFLFDFFSAFVMGESSESNCRLAWTWKLLNYERIVKFICSSPFWVSFFFFRLLSNSAV